MPRTTLVNNTSADAWMLELVREAVLAGKPVPEEFADVLAARTIEITDDAGTYTRVIVDWA